MPVQVEINLKLIKMQLDVKANQIGLNQPQFEPHHEMWSQGQVQ